ncbi:uncharacterized protein LOC6569873 isoform X1 [Drosophila grimshawi]|uniref:GH14234 n=1 Tax=Drosophila grimshawi TaxID=7222 RepID=B4JY61_DROGR|nr:uncharacterized protein LOC6569873 isoform X1 [Drosophila grimshawi]EDV90623.1 GH14234 [Drosophila grimshawi]
MSAAHEPTIHYLDSILNEEEKRCDQYSHQWRNFTISRSGRFRSKNKKRDVVDGKLFDGKENDKISARNTTSSAMSKSSSYATSATSNPSASTAPTAGAGIGATSMRSQRDNKTESYKSCYETSF